VPIATRASILNGLAGPIPSTPIEAVRAPTPLPTTGRAAIAAPFAGPIPITNAEHIAISTAAKTITPLARAAIAARQRADEATLASYTPSLTTVSGTVIRGQNPASASVGIIRPSNPTIPKIISESSTEPTAPIAVGKGAGNPPNDLNAGAVPMILVAAVLAVIILGVL
jgi:hypothetical protein